uniref:MCP four helix bundle domain-containing protein n=1 Tax=Kineococcus sp. SYSU DK006 TaxID=3383127 RepID=UPI003D7DC57A
MLTRLRDVKVASKLFAGFGVVCLLLAVVVAVGINRLQTAQANLHVVSTSGVASVDTIGDVRSAYLQVRMDITNAALATSPQAVDDSLKAMTATDAALDEAWQQYLASSPGSPAADRDTFEQELAEYRSVREQLVTLAEADDRDGYIAYRASTVAPVAQQITETLTTLTEAESAAAADLAAEGSAQVRAAVVVLLVLGAVAVAVAVAVAIAVSRSIAGPLAKTLAVVRGLAEGRLDQRVGITTGDEVGQLAGAVDATMERLAATMRRIAGNAGTLASSSEELTTVATQLSSGAEEAATQAQVVSAATEEISANIATVAAAGDQMSS